MSLTDKVSEVELWIEDYTEVEIADTTYYFKYDGARFKFYKKVAEDTFEITDRPRGKYNMNDLMKKR